MPNNTVKNKYLSRICLGASACLLSLLTGCAAIGTAVSHGSLETQTLMANSVFLDQEGGASHKTIYINDDR